jgi:UDP-N-acetylglucosamine transferase subunit ALG13
VDEGSSSIRILQIMAVFLTVGTTKFDSLVQTALSPKFQKTLADLGFKSLTVQSGKSTFKKEGDI